MTDFKNGQELLEVCKKKQCSISEVMKQREIEGTSSTKKEVEDKMRKALAIMKEAVRKPLEDPKPSMSGLIGGGRQSRLPDTERAGQMSAERL